MPRKIDQLLANNERWAKAITDKEPGFFKKLASQHVPDYMWIGCSDSRVSADQITGLMPGEVFVHRNIANVVVHTDLNCLSVLQYAVDVLKVTNIIVCGHYGCGGVRASMDGQKHGLIDNWLRHVQDVAHDNAKELSGLAGDAQLDRLCELNVLHQRESVARTTTVQDAWERGQPLSLHAWIYGLRDGRVRELGPELQDKAHAFKPPTAIQHL